MSDLKPCPFCGGEPYYSEYSGVVECDECATTGPMPPISEEALAAEAWNRRHQEAK